MQGAEQGKDCFANQSAQPCTKQGEEHSTKSAANSATRLSTSLAPKITTKPTAKRIIEDSCK